MDEIVSTVVANGIWAVLFCGLLVYELRDSRTRESRYTDIISELTEKLGTVELVKADTEAILADIAELKDAVKKPQLRRAAPEKKTGKAAEEAVCRAV